MNAGEKAIAKEMKRQEKERQKRMSLANKMLIPVSKKTVMSLSINSFDPSGVFYMDENRWVKIYQMEGKIEKIVEVVKSLTGRMRITLQVGVEGGREICHLTLMETGELYEEVRQKIIEDEAILGKVVSLHPMNVDEAMNEIAANFYKDIRFSYASYVRSNKDWKKELFFDVKEEATSFHFEETFGESFSVLSFPAGETKGLIGKLEQLNCPMYVCFDLNSLTEDEHTDFKRAIEKKYNKRLPISTEETFINLSLSVLILCDSDDARKILEETIKSVFLGQGIVISPSFHMQKEVAESILSLGLLDKKIMRNVSLEAIKAMFGGDCNADAEIEV